MPQAFGPFTNTSDKELLVKSLPKADLIYAREKTSFDYVKEFSSQNLKMSPDFTNLVKGVVPEYYKDGNKKIIIIPNNNMMNNKNDDLLWSQNYINALSNSVIAIKNLGYEPVLLNHEGRLDGEICQRVKSNVGDNALEIITEGDPLKVKGIIGASAALVSSRFHGCVSALCQGTPCLGTSWSHKYERLFEDYVREKFLMTPDMTTSQIQELLKESMNKNTSEYRMYLEKIQELKKDSEKMWDEISLILEK